MTSRLRRLRSVEARDVTLGDSRAKLGGFVVRTEAGRELGNLSAVVVDAAERRAVYLLVEATSPITGASRVVFSLADARLDVSQRAVLVPGDARPEVDSAAADLPRYSDQDLLLALFGHRAA